MPYSTDTSDRSKRPMEQELTCIIVLCSMKQLGVFRLHPGWDASPGYSPSSMPSCFFLGGEQAFSQNLKSGRPK